MVNRGKEFHDSDKGTAEGNSILQELRRHLAEPGPWPRRFRRLAEAIAQVEDVTLRQPLDPDQDTACEVCEALLDVYVDAELAGQAVRQRYPALWQHLQVCADCREAHDLLFETLAQERQGELQPLPQSHPPRLSFLEPPAPDVSWVVRFRSRLAGAPFGLTFTLNPTYLRDSLSPAQSLSARTRQARPEQGPRADRPPQPLLLLADTIPLEEGQAVVEVIATPDDQDPARLRLRATIAGTAPLPQNLLAVLKWGAEIRSGSVDEQGQVELGEVSLNALQAALEAGDQVFEITFEEPRGEDSAGTPAG